jgi:hypothetical protein
MKVIRQSNFKPLHLLSLEPAGLATALALLLLGASAPQLAAQSDYFDADGTLPGYPGPNAAPGWTAYSLPDIPDYGFGPEDSEAIYSFPTNPAGPGNYAYRIQAPPVLYDYSYGAVRAGSFRTDVPYGNASSASQGRFTVQADLVNWNNNWDGEVIGLAWYVHDIDNVNTLKGYVVGWGPGIATFGILMINLEAALSSGSIDSAYKFVGNTAEGSTLLDPNRKWRMAASSIDGTNFLATLYDLAQPTAPWVSAIGRDDTFSLTPGYCGIFEANTDTPPGLYDPTGNNTTDGADSTWDNYSASWPNPDAYPGASLPATVTELLPRPAGSATDYYPQGRVNILNRDSNVKLETIGIYMDGVRLPGSALMISNYVLAFSGTDYSNYPGAMVFWTITNLFPWGSWHTNKVVFQDDYNTTPSSWHTNVWSWTSAVLTRFATNGSLSLRGFDARLVQSYSTSADPAVYTNYANINCTNHTPPYTVWQAIGDGVASAQAVLNYQYAVSYAATNIAQLVNFDRSTTDSQMFNGNATTNYPGLCLDISDTYANSFAVEVLAYLQLPAGTNTFYVDSDDAVGVYTGHTLNNDSTVLLLNNGVTHQSFNWYVPQDGLYPVHILHEEGWGGAYLGLCTLDLTAHTTNVVNSAASPVKAFYPLVVESATAPGGPYAVDAAANAQNALQTADSPCAGGSGAIHNYTVTGGTLTVPISSSPKYYRLYGPRSTKFLSMTQVGSNLVITYQAN